MIAFSLSKRGKDVVKSAKIDFANTLIFSKNIYMVLGSFEVILDSFLMPSGDVSDAPEMYLWSSLIDNISSSLISANPKIFSPFWAVR